MKKKKIIAITALLVGAVLLLTGCSQKYVDNSEVGLQYGKGSTEGPKFKKCLPPGKSIQTNDVIYRYPRNQRNWKFQTDGRGADEKTLEFNSADGVQMSMVLTVTFELNTSCKPQTIGGHYYKGGTIQAFHELIARTRHAYFRDDGTYQTYPLSQDNGWSYVVSQAVGLPVHSLVRSYGPRFAAEPLWKNQAVGIPNSDGKQPADDQLAALIEQNLEKASNEITETDQQFFGNFHVEITDVEPSDSFKSNYADRRDAQLKAQTAELNKQAQVDEANAKAAILQAQIKGYGGFDNWLKATMVDKGQNPLQPTYVTGGAAQ